MLKVFLDANVVYAACVTNQEGASRVVLKLDLAGTIEGVLGDYVIEEARRNMRAKAPDSFYLFPQLVNADLYRIMSPSMGEA